MCFVAAWWVVFASDLHCGVVSIEMMPGIVGFILLACVPLNLASWPALPEDYSCYFLVARCKLLAHVTRFCILDRFCFVL